MAELEVRLLKNGKDAPVPLITVVMITLRRLLKDADEAGPIEAMNSLHALYDLYQLVHGTDGYTGDCKSCFGGNRQKLLDLRLVEGGPKGPLRVFSGVRDIVESALTVEGTFIQLVDPRADEHPEAADG